ncbi:hypothetical protein R3P38DRAFT_1333932 [Favolaschia claudopus]|uniref:F-box domain-containing protein n=1 Tax=Favolaschia claudopus TaxID=2862362 RepID=A0AAW0AU48_9AGAR
MLAHLETDRAFIAEKEAQILNLEAQILVLRQRITDIRAAQKPAQKRLDSYRYPVLSLPNEIVSEILVHAIPPYPQAPPTVSPTTLTHICRQWRDIALATQRLWRSLKLDRNAGASEAAWRALANSWVERAGSHPLSLYAHFMDPSLVFPTFGDRLEYLYAYPPSVQYATGINVDSSLPMLHSLGLDSLRYSFPVSFTLRDGVAPLLRTVSLDSIPFRQLTLPWAQLTSLTLKGITGSDTEKILRQSSRLVYCELETRGPTSIASDIQLPQLESLLILMRSPLQGADFLPHLVVPALRCFQAPETFLGSCPIEFLQSFISNSMCQLAELRVIDASTTPSQPYLANFPSISRIHVTSYRMQ